ncbi:efflux RND transporter periplasmic adaptor subunit [Vibrio algivorus]|uniref:MexE family multidrug efflux RND transporter periplasmic adaptor subunit n=1 Tax=Vibrio algivorus TaxID=1667024 RepID=A0ABQ6ERC3_9VIBR|nr:efflux RND transporter periplasmic adaptor subunit [Vibrio algivorus]GLT15727.1 MexE family multidrug efflux RND transporter periplasmic adaptor subunit [Vibrio algivorus]
MRVNRFNVGLLSTVLAIGIAGCDSQSSESQQQSKAPQATPVEVITMTKKPTTMYSELPARVVATRVSEVRPQVTGILQKRLFEEGQLVEQGDVLYQIDPAPYQADVNSAQAAHVKAKADEAVLKKTALRYKDLVQRKLISQDEYDTADGNWQQAKAQSAVAQAALDNAKISLSYTKVTAPISGRIDISNVTEGALVTANQEVALTTIQPLDPIYINMTQSSLSMAKIKKTLGSNDNPKVGVKLEDGTEYDQMGTLTFSGTKVDSSTGSVTLRAKVPNPDSILLPGMFVRAEIVIADQKPMYTLSQALVNFGQGGQATVFVVEDGKATIRPVKTGSTVNGNKWVIESGLKDGDQVISSNLMKLRPDAPVSIVSDDNDAKSTHK